MLALSELERIALLSSGVSIIVAFVTLAGVIYQSHKTRGELNTGNDHTIGQASSRIEDTLWRHEQRLDTIEVLVTEDRNALAEHIDAAEVRKEEASP